MPDLDVLRGLARDEPGVQDEPVLAVEAAAQGGTLGALQRYFGEDDGRQGVTLVVDGERVGHVSRGDAIGPLAEATRGSYGSSSGMALPGHAQYRLLRLRCPIPGCPTPEILVMNYDEDDPPRCPTHRGVDLERA